MLKKIIFSILAISLLAGPALAQFDPSYIMSDMDLTNKDAMDLGQIQDFLEQKNSYLANYVDPNVKWNGAYIIDFFSRFHGINPKYTLVLLQKEQSLIEDESPSQGQMDWATGYGICDDCSKSDPKLQKYKGFFNQVDWGVGGTRFYLDNPDKFTYQVGKTYTIDRESVTIKNDATRVLYTYTPHLHGNQNLHKIWEKWFAASYLEGSLLQNTEDGGIWLVRDGERHPFLSKSAYLSRYGSFERVILTSPTDLAKYPVGSAIEYPNYSLLQIPTGGIYLLDDDTLKPIASKEAFRLIGFNPEEVIQVESNDIFPYKIGHSITEKSAYPTGGLLQDNTTGGVYYVQDGKKYPIVSKRIMNYYYGDKKITAVTPEELENYETQEAIKMKDGELVVGEKDPTVYVISDGEKRPFGSESDFLGMGYKFKNVVNVEDNVLALHDTGEAVTMHN